MKEFKVYSEPLRILPEMLSDIKSAKRFIYIETHVYNDDSVGKLIRDSLIKKAKQGVEIKLLIDGWNSHVNLAFFEDLIKLGGEVKIFKEIKSLFFGFRKHNERNHRKLFLVDNISYIGSMNLSSKEFSNRELVLRVKGGITKKLVKSFLNSFEIHGKLTRKKFKTILYKNLEIIQDFPSLYHRITESKYKKLIEGSKKSIFIETPYFVPSDRIVKSLIKSINRGVDVSIIIPKESDVGIIDVVRNRFLGRLYIGGVKIYLYKKSNLHAKLLIVDDKFFMFGTSNVDYRSFLYQYDINFLGKNKEIIKELKKHFGETLIKSEPFDYNVWKGRSSFKKLIELFLLRIKRYL